MRPQRTPAKTPRRGTPRSGGQMDPVEVCCRVRTLPADAEESCIEIKDDKALRMSATDGRAIECQFSRIFGENIGQDGVFNVVAKPMVDGMLKGKNGLLFTYGVTSSGKTYTMTGTVDNPGFLPRSLDMLFNSLEGVLATKYSFIPDNMNGFSVQPEADAMLEKQEREILPRTTTPMKTPNKSRNRPDLRYEIDYCRSEHVNSDMRYAVFISYVEIYNDYVYDLLEDIQYDPFSRPKPPQSKRLREDKKHNMFVYGVTEVEITTTEEAFSVFKRGQERRRIAHTQLNAESSRSHSIFNIRLVQAPLDPLGEDLLQDKSLICVSQLSLVDLAGSERLARTGAGGERLREAGNINSSLMTLRRCLEQLRENQRNNGQEMVIYRNSKVTHLFKMYFEGRGQVKMVVCVNPNIREYDENVHVMQFAEMAQQVEVVRAEEFHLDRESIRKKAEEAKKKAEEERRREMTAARKLNNELAGNALYQRGKKKCRRNLSVTSQSSDTTDITEPETTPLWIAPDFSLGPPFPNLGVVDLADENTIPDLMSFLEARIQRKEEVLKSITKMETQLRMNVVNNTEHDTALQNKLEECHNALSEKTKDVSRMEKQIKKLEAKNQVLMKTTQVFEHDKKTLNEHLAETNLQLKESQLDNRKLESRMRGAIANQKSQYEKQVERRVRNVQTEMQEKMWVKEERLRQLKSIIAEGREGRSMTRKAPMSTSSLATSESSGSSRSQKLAHKRRSRSADNLLAGASNNKTPLNKSRRISTSDQDLRKTSRPPKKSVSSSIVSDPALPVAQKHTRGKSSGNNNWLAHQPSSTLNTGTIMQPCIKPGKIVHIPSPKDIKNADKYLLTHQKEDKQGEIETQLIKGEVIQTRSGGQQVQFVDIETLKQRDPQKNNKKDSSARKRKSDGEDGNSSDDQSSWTDVETRCSTAIENKMGSGAGPVIYNHPKRRK
ncbi:kinesin-like protein KIF23 [Styela clava]